MLQQGRQPDTVVLRADVQPADERIATRLQLPTGEKVFHIERLRRADGQPGAYETRYLAVALCPRLLEEDLSHDAIHRLLIDKYRIPLLR
ncbi:MAG: UTRA domain-containing protein, partial [Caldilineae bacterium]